MSRRRILLVEDEALISLDIEATLADLGHEVAIAPTVAEALAMVEAGGLHLAILNYRLKNGNTTAVAARLREAGVAFIVCSGSFEVSELNAAFAGVRVLSKPFSTDSLIEAVAGATAYEEETTA